MPRIASFPWVRLIREELASARAKLKSRLGLKLLAVVVITVFLGTVLSSILILTQEHQHLITTAHNSAQDVGRVVQASLEHAMLSNDKAMLDAMLEILASESSLKRVSILTTDGRVWLSSAPAEPGQRFEAGDPTCRVCHLTAPTVSPRTTAPVSQISGDTMLHVVAFENRPLCYGCHPPGVRVLGYLLLEMPMGALDDQWILSFLQVIFSAAIIFLLLVGLLTPALGKFVVQPVEELARSATEIGAGNLDSATLVKSDDEVGQLAAAFDTMRRQLKAALVEKERRNRELQMLNEIARATSQLLDPQQILDLTIHIAVTSLGVQAGAIYLLNRECGQFSLHACQGMPECREMACHLWAFNRVLTGLKQPDSQVVTVPITAGACYEMWQDAEGRSFIGVPLKAKGMLLGAMTFVTHSGQQVTDEGTRTLKEMGEQIGLALANALHFQTVRSEATLEERERLAREMHDSLAQALGYLKLQTSLTDDLLSRGQISQAQANLRQVKQVAKETYADVREAIFGLRHVAAPGAEFVPAFEEYLSEYCTHYGVQVQLIRDENCRPVFSDQVCVQVTRIIQEALTNIRKHAMAKQATVRFGQVDHSWRITIADDGQGFDLQGVPKAGRQFLGLQIMRERAATIGAELTINTRPGGGTAINIQVPFGNEQQDGTTSTYPSRR